MFGSQPTYLVILFILLLALLIPILIIAAGVFIALRFRRSQQRFLEAITPMEILEMRYANGEITKEQFDQMNRDLESK